ncbi:DoxX family membrane protein [Solirubrobacter ginsenosidimutans]|uniref:DoxX family membrane protein n=1 Tax=Solirubrobacter ginsenosidimutans TaxID=490573 RepID=A0A9X3N0L5_9ACTN|nr:DoxX family membrane protein [Solirubrobacter ginsenosidimutans]
MLRTVGRGMIATLFLIAGVDVLRHPQPRAEVAHDTLERLRSAVRVVPDDVTAVRANAATQLVAATLLTFGKAPRAAAGVLAASLVPTTLAGHAFWTFDDPAQSAQQRAHFAKNLAILGGLILAALPPEEDG